MIISSRRASLAALAALALSAAALATPASAATDAWRHSHSGGRWHGAAEVWTPYGHAGYRHWPYRPGESRIDEGPGFYEGYGHNWANSCYSGESMYDGC